MSAKKQIEKLANSIKNNYPKQIKGGGAADVAIEIIKKMEKQITFEDMVEFWEEELEGFEKFRIYRDGSGRIKDEMDRAKCIFSNYEELRQIIQNWKQSNNKEDKYEPINNIEEWQVAAKNNNLYFEGSKGKVESLFSGKNSIDIEAFLTIKKYLEQGKYFNKKE